MLRCLIIFQLDMGPADPVNDLEIVWLNIKDYLAFLNTTLPLLLLQITQ